jgi:predicted metal-binding membrane protein
MWPAQTNGRALVGLLLGLASLAWLSLAIWGLTPYRSLLHHDALGQLDVGLSERFLLTVGVFALGWVLMVSAMMLPTVVPLVALFRTMTRQRRHAGLLIGLLLGGYIAIWSGFGILSHIGDYGLHRAVDSQVGLSRTAWVFAALPLLLAGVYQFTPLKHRCLEKCRSPYLFIMERWRGGHPASAAFRLGVSHGLFCVGCCWPLMLVMFAVGTGNLAWMLALSIVMAVEKNVPWGRRLTTPLGIALIALGLATLARSLRL